MHVVQLLIHEAAVLKSMPWAVCHCSAGVGRTGTFVALIKLLRELELGQLSSQPETLDSLVASIIEAMRERRLWMVNTDTEFATLYATLMLRLRNPCNKDFKLSWRASYLMAANTPRAPDADGDLYEG